MVKIIKATRPLPKDNDCNCGKQVKKTERKKIVYKKTIKRTLK